MNDLEITKRNPQVVKTELDDDLEMVREKQISIIEKGHGSVDSLIDVAEQSQHPRAYEVLSIYLKTLSELNRDMVAIAERKSFKEEGSQPNITNQNLFVGTMKELQDLIKPKKSDA